MKRVSHTVFAILIGLSLVSLAGCRKEGPTAEPKPETAAATPAKAYPLDTCIVADEKLGSMGDPYVFVHEGQEVKLCCKGCLKDFQKEPAKYLPKLSAKKA